MLGSNKSISVAFAPLIAPDKNNNTATHKIIFMASPTNAPISFLNIVGEVALIPDATGGVFDVHIDGQLVWSRAAQERFPELKEIKQAVRDIVAPGRDLGHVDN